MKIIAMTIDARVKCTFFASEFRQWSIRTHAGNAIESFTQSDVERDVETDVIGVDDDYFESVDVVGVHFAVRR